MDQAAAAEEPTERPRRRTQEERSAATRTALLDATVVCLTEYGYSGMTMRHVVDRAGMSRGAQSHHFATKATLVVEAIRYLAETWSAEVLESLEQAPTRRSVGTLLDRLWEWHTGPLFKAVVELWVAGRTDPELRESLRAAEVDLMRTVRQTARTHLSASGGAQLSAATIDTVLYTMQGLALRLFLFGEDAREAQWRRVRADLVVLLSAS